MSERTRRPAFQFYPADWRKDPALQVCSLPARGLWVEMLCIMHEAEPYGHLSVNGLPLDAAQLARLVGESPAVVKRLLAELEAAGVFSRTDARVVYSRRMVRDEHIREVRADAGKKGGNPALVGSRADKQGGSDLLKQTDKQKPTPSSSSSSSSSEEPPPAPPAGGEIALDDPWGDGWKPRDSHVQMAAQLDLDLSAQLALFRSRKRRPRDPDRMFERQLVRAGKRMLPLPPSWVPPESLREVATREGRDFDRELAKFRSKALARGYTYVDWDAAFRSWLTSDFDRTAGGVHVAGVAGEPDGDTRRAAQADERRRKLEKERQHEEAETRWTEEVGALFDALPKEERDRWMSAGRRDFPHLARMPGSLERMARRRALEVFGERSGKPAPVQEAAA